MASRNDFSKSRYLQQYYIYIYIAAETLNEKEYFIIFCEQSYFCIGLVCTYDKCITGR